jgi:hypothetical protein
MPVTKPQPQYTVHATDNATYVLYADRRWTCDTPSDSDTGLLTQLGHVSTFWPWAPNPGMPLAMFWFDHREDSWRQRLIQVAGIEIHTTDIPMDPRYNISYN